MGKRNIKDDQFEINVREIKAKERGLDPNSNGVSLNTAELKKNRAIDNEVENDGERE